MAAKQRGALTKPMFVVPGQVLRKWQQEFVDLFPDAKTLVIELLGDREGTELARAQAQNWDAIFIPDSAFKRLPLSPDERAKRLRQRIEDFEAQIEAAKRRAKQEADSQQANRVEKKLNKQLEELRTKVRDIQEGTEREEGDIYFDELGVDALVFDEAHLYKNALGTPLGQKLGIAKSASETSERAEDALQKSRWVHDQNEGSNVWTLTATPVQNSPIEIWHMLNLCAPQVLKKYDIQYLDDFIHLFVEKQKETTKKVGGEYKREESITGYSNLPEMRRIIDEAADVKSYEQLQNFYDDNPQIASNFERPPHELKQEIIEATELHDLLFDDIEIRAAVVLDMMKNKKPGEDPPIKDNFLSITKSGSKIATDLRVYDEEYVGHDLDMDQLKIEKMFENVVKYYEGEVGATLGEEDARENPRSVAITPTNRSAAGTGVPVREKKRKNPPPRNQIIFCDSITLKGESAGTFSQLMKDRLVELGIPEDEIVVATGSMMTLPDGNGGFSEQSVPSDRKQEAKRNIQERFNEGTHRILIGNSTVEEGMNLDKWGVAVHHLDIPYRPSRIQQRNGRMVRQGNKYGKVDVYFYLLQGSFDEYRLQLVQSKQGWIDELFYGEVRHAEGETGSRALSYEQMQAATAEDDRVERFFSARQDLQTLEQRISTLESEVAQLQQSVEAAKEDVSSKESTLEPTLEQERMIQTTEWDWDDPGEAVAEGVIDIGEIEDQKYRSGYEIDVELSVTETRDFTGVSNIDLTLDVPLNNANARVKWDINVREGRRQFYGQKRQSDIFNYAKNELDSFLDPNGSLEWLDEHNRSGVIADQEDYYEYYEIENPRQERGDRTFEEYKSDIGMNEIQNWAPIVRDHLSALFFAAEHRWYRRAERREERTVEDLEAAKENLDTVQTQLEQTKSELSDAREDRQSSAETVEELRGVVNEIQQHEYPTRPEVYERINEIAPRYGLEPPIRMHTVGDRQSYLTYIGGWTPSNDENTREVQAVTVEDDTSEDAPWHSEDPERPPVVSSISDLIGVIESQTDRLITNKSQPRVETIREALPEINVWIERGTGIPEYIVDTTQDNMWTKMRQFGDTGKKRLAGTRRDVWTNGVAMMFGDVGVSARNEFDRQYSYEGDPELDKGFPLDKFESLPDDARRVSIAGYSQGPEGKPLLMRFTETDEYALDFDTVGFVLRHADIYDPEEIGEDIWFVKGLNDPKFYLMRDGSASPKATIMPVELGPASPENPRENPQLPLIRERKNPETEPLVFLGTSHLLRVDGKDIQRDWLMFTRSAMDVLLLVPEQHVEISDEAPEGVSDEREEWRHHPPKGVGMTVEVAYEGAEILSSPDRIEYKSDKMIREHDDGDVHAYYHDFTDDHTTVQFKDGTVLVGANVENGQIEDSGSIEIDERGILN